MISPVGLGAPISGSETWRATQCHNGIPRERLVPKGYGETKPAEVPDDEGNIIILTPEYINSLLNETLKEDYHQRNRRTAFFVLEQN